MIKVIESGFFEGRRYSKEIAEYKDMTALQALKEYLRSQSMEEEPIIEDDCGEFFFERDFGVLIRTNTIPDKAGIINSIANKYVEAFEDDKEEAIKFIEERWKKAEESYPPNVPIRYCLNCRMPLVYNSMAYYEGWHFDTCF
jgi:hypothetical protein